MLTDKELKAKYLPIFSKDPSKYYPTTVLEAEGYHRSHCGCCHKYFWSTDPARDVCGDPSCSPDESFGFIGKSPATKQLSYADVWKQFSKQFNNLGYTPIKRYPIVARWNPTMEFTNASIAAFQPHVVSGESTPPANPLVIPQFCFRTVDIDNVGITGSHHTVFNMIGQHQFVEPSKWDQAEAFRHIHEWNTKGLGLQNSDITYHEDSWAGGGNLGCCIEFFSRGCELGNQVYMLYQQTPTGIQDLKLKVLDMGMGMERNAWFSQGVNTTYDATFPDIMKKVFSATGVQYDRTLIQKYIPHAGLLNIDEVNDIEKAWKTVAHIIGVDVDLLRKNVLPLAGAYSIAEHARSLLILLGDGALPSNTGQAYNIRTMLRRALDFVEHNGWKIDLNDVCAWHAADLKTLFPELHENLEDVKKIIDVEVKKYNTTRQKSHTIIQEVIAKGTPDAQALVKLYDERGISPELLKQEAQKLDIAIDIPGNFYALVGERHENKAKEHVAVKKLDISLEGIPETKLDYYGDYSITEFTAVPLLVKDTYVVLDHTYFYATSGGQLHDLGSINGTPVIDVVKQDNVMIHILEQPITLSLDQPVKAVIDAERRLQLAQHHTSAHILNAAAKHILGNHINQAGAHKQVDRARLDITHYAALTDHEVAAIEQEANNIIQSKINIQKDFYERGDAEKKFGVGIYQGGVVPGKTLRIVNIPDIDVEACGGTHLNNTSEAGTIKITKTSKISDSIVRIEYVAGNAAEQQTSTEDTILTDVATLLQIDKKGVAIKAAELFSYWKQIIKKKKDVTITFSNDQEELSDKELLEKTAHILKTQPEHLTKTIKRFMDDLKL